MLNRILASSRHLARRILRRSPGIRARRRIPVEFIGSGYGGWTVAPELISRESIVYSFGVGEDISFDVGMIARFDVTVHAFDPTPRSVAWLRDQSVPDAFHFHEYGIGSHDGLAQFYPPENDRFVSYSIVERGAPGAVVEVSVRRLTTIMEQLGHQCVDVLKLDIEGSEYDVLDDVVREDIPVKQLLVEFHHFLPRIPVGRTRAALQSLCQAGFEVFSVSSTEREFSLIHRSAL